MIMMLIRTALWGLAIIAAALAFVWLKDTGGGVTVTLGDRAYGPFRPIEFIAIVLVIGLAVWLLIKLFSFLVALVRFFSGDETALSRFWNRSRERRGFDAVSAGLALLAEGDGRAALTKARKAERLLERPGLTRLLVARSAEASGETALAKDYYKRLASDPDTAIVGVKGLLRQAQERGETERALKLASHAFELKPRDPDVLTTLFDLQCQAADWAGARRTLAAQVRVKALTRDVGDRREAVLLVAEARAAGHRAEVDVARDLANRAHKRSPGLIPATITAAQNANADGDARRAAKMLREAWRTEPHPDIAAAFAALAPDETPEARRKRFGELTKIKSEHPETRMLAAELALADKDWPAARKTMADLAETHPSARALALMAAIEKGDGADEALVRGWLSRAVAAPPPPQWTCGNCGARHAEWMPVCRRCEAFDTLAWREGEADTAGADSAAAMLPVLAEDPLVTEEPGVKPDGSKPTAPGLGGEPPKSASKPDHPPSKPAPV